MDENVTKLPMFTNPELNILNPFWAAEIMEAVGFGDVHIYDNFDLNKEVHPISSAYRTVVTARKKEK